MPLISSNNNQIVYGRTSGSRWFSGIAAPCILALFTSLPLMLWSHLPWSVGHSPLELAQPLGLLLLMETCGIAISLTGFYGAGPEDLILDLTTRTYRFRRGFPLLAHWKTGPFSDFAGVELRTRVNKKLVFYRVVLTWRDTSGGNPSALSKFLQQLFKEVQIFATQSEAEATRELNTAAERLSLPIVSDTNGQAIPEQIQSRSIRMTVIGIVIAALLLGVLAAPPLVLQLQLDAQGKATTGTVTQARFGSKHSFLDFTYSVDGRTLHGEDDITRATAMAVGTGDSVDVTYLPNYPKTCRTNYSNTKHESVLFLSLYGGWLVLGSLYSVYQFSRKRPQNRQS
jgi:hypothetical protein